MTAFTKKSKLFLLFGIFLFQAIAFSQHRNNKFSSKTYTVYQNKRNQTQEILFPKSLNKEINKEANYFLTYDYAVDNTKINIENYQNFAAFTAKYPNPTNYPVNTKSIWVQFSIKNTTNQPLETYINAMGHHFDLYEINQKKLTFLATFGKYTLMKNLSLENDFFNAPIFLKPYESKTIILQVKQNNYFIFLPSIRLIDKITRLQENAQISSNIPLKYVHFTYIVLGFLVFFLFFCCYQIVLSENKISFIYLAILDIVYLLYFSTNYNIFHIEIGFLPHFSTYETASYSGILFPPAHFLFILSLIKNEKKSYLKKALYLSLLFYVFIFAAEYSDFQSPILCHFFLFIIVHGVLYSAAILVFLYIYLSSFNDVFYKLINFGLLLNLFAVFLFALNFSSLRYNLNLTFITNNFFVICLIHELAVVIDFSIFFYAILLRDKNKEIRIIQEKQILETEKQHLIEQHNTTLEELKTVKKLIEKQNIILKDKTKINLDQLIFIKADDHYLNVHTIDGKKHFVRGKLNEITQELPGNFVKCHRSYIVNKNYIKQTQSKFLLMSDHSEVPISRNFKF